MSDNRNNSQRRFAAPLLLMGFIFVLSSIPDHGQSDTFLGFIPPTIQNLLHIPLFALLAWLWCRALTGADRRLAVVLALAGAISFAWSLSDEFHQLYVPGRYASLTDVTLNLLGVLIGLGIHAIQHRQAEARP